MFAESITVTIVSLSRHTDCLLRFATHTRHKEQWDVIRTHQMQIQAVNAEVLNQTVKFKLIMQSHGKNMHHNSL